MKIRFASALATATLLCVGCVGVKMVDTQRGITASAHAPAWPWQDSTTAIKKMTVSARGTNFNAALTGYDNAEVTSTNATAMIQAVTAGAVEGAIKGASLFVKP